MVLVNGIMIVLEARAVEPGEFIHGVVRAGCSTLYPEDYSPRLIR
jgi:hypothetical protein